MKLLLKVVGGFAALILALLVVAFFFPREYRVERTVVTKAKAEAVMAQVGDLKMWKNWGAWQERDPGMKLTYAPVTTGVGAWSAWESEKEGNGKMTITLQTPTKVSYLLEFPDMGTKSNGSMELIADAGGTRVVWVDAGDLGHNPVNRWVGLFLEKIIGPDFERGLANLKRLVEK
jgi:hypothetical protein